MNSATANLRLASVKQPAATDAVADVPTQAQEEPTDNTLVALFLEGDMQAYNTLVERYKERIYTFIYFQINQKPADAEDLTQDVFVELYRQAANYRGESKFSTWLFSVSRNIVLNYFRSRRRRYMDQTDSISDHSDESDQAPPPELTAVDCPATSAQEQQLHERVDDAIEQLGVEERQLLLLTDREGFSYEQIANILCIKVGTVRSRLNKARQRLLQFIKVNDHEM